MATLTQRVDQMAEDIDELKEGQEEIRSGVNTLLEWAEEVGGTYDFPIPKMKI